ncbi:MAG: sugar phosphate nucleotidyltransferase [Asgard group archaeon]|nr:sugar phosphate nucleotidyltransferase [Asgard group archaeon]
MKAIIIAAGKGKRMRPLTETRLKGSLPVQNQAILKRLITMMETSGIIDEYILVISPGQKEEIKSLFTENNLLQKIALAIQDPAKGTGDAVAQAKAYISSNEELCFVINGDIYAPLSEILPKLLTKQQKSHAKCVMGVIAGRNKRYGLLKLKSNGEIIDIKEKVGSKENRKQQTYINCGIYLFSTEIFDTIEETTLSPRGEYEITDAISLLSEKGKICTVKVPFWISMENPGDLFLAQRIVSPSENQLSMQFHSGGEIGFTAAKELYIEAGEEVQFSSVNFIGPVLVGKGTIIESGSKIGPYVYLGDICEIGAKTTLQYSLLFERVRLETSSKISHLIAGEECLIGSHCKINPAQNQKSLEKYSPLEDSDFNVESLFLIIGGKSIIPSKSVISKHLKLHAHGVYQKTG